MFTKILVPMDGSELSEAILPCVAYLARRLDIPVELVSIVDAGTPTVAYEAASPGIVQYQSRLPFISYAADEQYYTGVPGRAAPEDDPSVRSRYQYDSFDQNVGKEPGEDMIEVQVWLYERASWLGQQGVSVVESEVVAAIGKPSEEIIEYADLHNCDLIAMATHDRNLLGQALRGSVTNAVIRSSPVPVIAITPEKQKGDLGQSVALSSVLVPLDGSPFAESVLPYVENLAVRLGLEVVLVQALGLDEVLPPAGAGGTTTVPQGSRNIPMDTTPEQVATTDASRYLENIAERLGGIGIKARWEVITGGAAQDIAKMAQNTPDSMIALASHSRSGISRWVTGSVAEELLRGSGSPVLIISSKLADGKEESQTR
jgi:nucleotide-binding universal stress UspA family protein